MTKAKNEILQEIKVRSICMVLASIVIAIRPTKDSEWLNEFFFGFKAGVDVISLFFIGWWAGFISKRVDLLKDPG